MKPGGPAVCVGEVHHRRSTPAAHAFTNAVRYVWIDPDRPEDLTRHHWAWSATRPAPMRFRATDYGRADDTETTASPGTSLGDAVRDDLADALGYRPGGEVRMLSQLRQLGWLFNPITVFVAWDTDTGRPVGAVLEVTNTPWKERHRYPVPLHADAGRFTARFDKVLHVSPFLDEAFVYDLSIEDRDDRVVVELDVVARAGAASGEATTPTVSTRLDVARAPANRATLAGALRAVPLSTHRVSAGIHTQALRLWRKRVPFVAHPRQRTATDPTIAAHPTDDRSPRKASR